MRIRTALFGILMIVWTGVFAEVRTIAFTESDSLFPNPERGWIAHRTLADFWGIPDLRNSAERTSIILLKVDLSSSVNLDHVAPATLTAVENALQSCRDNGLKALFRAAYADVEVNGPEPSSLDRVIAHIHDFTEIFHNYSDVIIACEAGFLGPWGEWHSSKFSTNTTTLYYPIATPAAQAVHAAFMTALPGNRQVIMRRPFYIREICGTDLPLSGDEAFGTSALARTGYHNDAYLNSEDEGGTFSHGWTREEEMVYIEQMSRYTFFGGETFGTPNDTYNNGPAAYADSKRQHMTYLNHDYLTSIYDAWGTDMQSAFTRELGYRFVVDSMRCELSGAVGDSVPVALYVRNAGFSSPHLERPAYVVLTNGTDRIEQKLAADPRRWDREYGPMNVDAGFRIPANAAPGVWQVSLWLPDPAPSLKNDSRYSIRLANENVWNPDDGTNLLMDGFEVLQSTGIRSAGVVPVNGIPPTRTMSLNGVVTLDRSSIASTGMYTFFTPSGRVLSKIAGSDVKGARLRVDENYSGVCLVRYTR